MCKMLDFLPRHNVFILPTIATSILDALVNKMYKFVIF